MGNDNKELMNKNFKVTQEKDFVMLKNFRGNIIIATKSYNTPAKFPQIVYDGKDHAMLYRDEQNIKILDYINENIRNELLDSEEITIIELDDDKKIKYEYQAKMINVNSVNIDKKDIITMDSLSDEDQINIFEQIVTGNPNANKLGKVLTAKHT